MKKKLLLTLSVIVLILAAIWSISSLNTMSISLRAGEISYVRICLNPYRYDTGDEFITLHMDDPEESGIIHWFITEFSGQYAFDSTDFSPAILQESGGNLCVSTTKTAICSRRFRGEMFNIKVFI